MLRIPTKGLKIGRSEETQKLYELEEKAGEMIQRASLELGRVMKKQGKEDLQDIYRELLPEELLTILDTFDLQASILASTAFLEKEGFQVTKKGGQ